jgi:fatty acid desaturase
MQLLQFFIMIAQACYLMATGCKTFPPNTTKLYFYYILTMIALFGQFFAKNYLGKGKGGKSKDRSVDANENLEANEVLIDGVLYNVSNFRHPGGSIIKFLQGKGDASEAFASFHLRSKKAKAILRGLPQRACPAEILKTRAPAEKKALVADFQKLLNDLREEGFFEPSMGEVIYRISELLVMFAVGAYLFLAVPIFVVKAFGLFVLGLAQGRCGWLMHEGGHVSLTGKWKVDHMLQVIIYGVGCGMSAGWWRVQHNKHHATPQKLAHDADLDTLPLVSFNAAVSAKVKNPVIKAWLRMQAYLFIPVTCALVCLGWQFFLHPRYMLRTKKYEEFASFGLRYVLLFGWLLGGHSWVQAVGLYVVMMQVSGSYIFTNFAMSHTHLDVTQPDEFITWTEYAAKHTTNLSNHWFVNWWMAYLNFQIEHHMFPSMPQFRHPIIAPRVKALIEKHGMHYDVRGYFSCLGDTLNNLAQVGNPNDSSPKKNQ